MKTLLFLSFLICFDTITFGQSKDESEKAIRTLIEESYIHGVHIKRDHDLIRSGFHKDFKINVRLNEDNLFVGSLDMWLERLGHEQNDSEITYNINQIDVTRNSAMTKVEIFSDGKLKYTDYMILYKFSEGWKIISKVFEGYE